MFRSFVLFLVVGSLYAQTGATISGKIFNETTQQPVRAEWIVLAKSGQGLETVQQLENVSEYAFKNVPTLHGAPYLVRASYEGVLYTQNILIQDAKEHVVNLSVYHTTEKWSAVTVRIPHLIIVRNGGQLEIQQTFEIQNSGNRTFYLNGEHNPTFRFQIPANAQLGQVMTSHNRSIPVAAAIIDDKGAQGIHLPLRPGATQIQLNYVVGYQANGLEFRSKVFYDISECNVFVSPANISVESGGLVQQQDAQLAANNFAVYALANLKANSDIALNLSGGTETQREPHVEDRIVANPNTIQSAIWVLLPAILAVCMFALYFALQKKTTAPASEKHTRVRKASSRQDSGDLLRQKESLATRIADLDDRFDQKTLDGDEYDKKRSELKSELIRVARAIEKLD